MAEYFWIGFFFWLGVIVAKTGVLIITKSVYKLCEWIEKKQDEKEG